MAKMESSCQQLLAHRAKANNLPTHTQRHISTHTCNKKRNYNVNANDILMPHAMRVGGIYYNNNSSSSINNITTIFHTHTIKINNCKLLSVCAAQRQPCNLTLSFQRLQQQVTAAVRWGRVNLRDPTRLNNNSNLLSNHLLTINK